MLQRDDNLMRGPDDEEQALGSLGKWRLSAVFMVVIGLGMLFLTEPPRGPMGLLAWLCFAFGVAAIWISYTRVGRDISYAAEEWVDRGGTDNRRDL